MKAKKDNKYPNLSLDNPYSVEDINMNQDQLVGRVNEKMGDFQTETSMMRQVNQTIPDNGIARPLTQFMNIPGPPCIS